MSDRLKKLAETWRTQAAAAPDDATEAAFYDGMETCADELEAALAEDAQPAPTAAPATAQAAAREPFDTDEINRDGDGADDEDEAAYKARYSKERAQQAAARTETLGTCDPSRASCWGTVPHTKRPYCVDWKPSLPPEAPPQTHHAECVIRGVHSGPCPLPATDLVNTVIEPPPSRGIPAGMVVCHDCGGSGQGPEHMNGPDVEQDKCPECDGKGLIKESIPKRSAP
jgi:hypothetical protein